MYQKHKNGTKVFNWYYDLDTTELKVQELVVSRWDYLDGMQWDVIDEYILIKETKEPYFKFFKKSVKKQIRLPGYLVSPDKMYAKVMLVDQMLKSFGYMLDESSLHLCSKGTYTNVQNAKEEYKSLVEYYPELIVKVHGEFKPERTNSGWMWR